MADVVPFNDRITWLEPAAGTIVLPYDYPLATEAELALLRLRDNEWALLTFPADFTFPGGLGNDAGGQLSLASASVAGDHYILSGSAEVHRKTDYVNRGGINPLLLNADLNKIIKIVQEASRDGRAALKFRPDRLPVSTFMPDAEAGRAVMWAADGSGLVNGPDGADISQAQDYAAAAAESAASARQDALDAQAGLGRPFSSLAAAALYSPTVAPSTLPLSGYYSAGDCPPFQLIRAVPNADPGHGASVVLTLADGVTNVWYTIAKYRAYNSRWFGAKENGVDIDTAYWQKLLDFVRVKGGAIEVTAGKPVIDQALLWTATGAEIFQQGPVIRGAGKLATVFDNRVANGAMLRLRNNSQTKFILGLDFSEFSIGTTTAPANSTALSVRGLFQCNFDINIDGATVDGIYVDMLGADIVATAGDQIASNMVRFNTSRITNCGRWGINIDSAAGFNETSYLTLDQLVVQGCGTAVPGKTITGITKANPGVVTAVAHGFSNGDRVYLLGVGGMTQVNGEIYVVAGVTANTFQLSGINTTAFGTFTAGGVVRPLRPTSGGMKYKGQALKTGHSAFAVNNNVGLYVQGGAGLSNSLAFEPTTTFENNLLMHLLVEGAQVMTADGYQMYSSTAHPTAFGFIFDATESVIRNLRIGPGIVRATAASSPHKAYKVFGANADAKTITIDYEHITFDDYGYAGQTKFSGFKDRPNVKVYKTTAQNVLVTMSAIVFDVEESDLQDCYDPATGRYLDPFPGVYRFSGDLTCGGLTAGQTIIIQAYNESTAAVLASVIRGATGANPETFPYNFTLNLPDSLPRLISIRAQTPSGTVPLTVGNGGYNTLTVENLPTQN